MASKLLPSRVEFFVVPVLCYWFLFFTEPAKAVVPAIYVFGDTLADFGNNDYLKLSLLKADFPHNGVDYPGGKATGRFSNGKNFADFLAENLGIPSPLPYLSIPKNSNNTEAFLKGVNFASGGAGAMDSTNSGQCLGLSMQIDYYSTVYTDLVQDLGSGPTLNHLSNSIFAFIIGSNDILNYVKKKSSSSSLTEEQLIDSMSSSLTGQLKRTYNLGARKFAIVGTGPIGCCPEQRKNSSSGDCNAQTNSISLQFIDRAASVMQEMKSGFGDMDYSFLNTSMALLEYIENPETYGFAEVKAACCGLFGKLNAGFACIPISELCTNRSNHIFWDRFHPTETTARLLTSTFFSGLSPYVFPINVQQLST